ncbi:MAG: hypothetical protein HY736_09270 [Verrucomicrobia bacterium]|nr:hypothetical protein [Verrucomicrobiota bacterium]
MRIWQLQFLGFCLVCSALTAAAPESAPVAEPKPVRVFVIPIQDQVGPAVLYIVRRGLKEAIAEQAEAVVFDMKTPGGALDTTFEIMEAIGKFPGVTLTYVNTEAISAGAFIAATTDEIWFAPSGIIGAAAPVSMGGQEVDTTMKQKIVSYLKARVRAMSEGKGYRGRVISAMIDADTELKIEDEVLKGKGELLSLTSAEAMKTYGEPPQPLLAAGLAKTIEELLAKKFSGRQTTVTTLELTWSERLAVWLNAISPVLLGIGLLALFIEFKTPGFGLFGIAGIVCLAIVFLGNYAAGMSGHEPLLVFGAGLVLVAVEIFFFPGVAVMIVAGLVLMFGALIWSMADLWPNEPLSVAWAGDAFVAPLANLGLGILIAVALGVALARFIPRGWVWNRMVLSAAVEATAQGESGPAAAEASLVGALGIAVTALRPGGQVEIAGRRYEAKVEVGAIDAGTAVVVRGHSDFGLVVERAGS